MPEMSDLCYLGKTRILPLMKSYLKFENSKGKTILFQTSFQPLTRNSKGPFTSSDCDVAATSLPNGSQSYSPAMSQSLGVTMQHQNN